MVSSNAVTLTVTPPAKTPITIALIYPAYGVAAGDTITVRGSGFTRTGIR